MARTTTTLAAIAFAAALGAGGVAHAYSVTHHSTVQQGRINRGKSTGALTSTESNHLQARQNNITATAKNERAANGGTLTTGEKARLGARQAALSGRIAVQKHDGQTAPEAAPPQ